MSVLNSKDPSNGSSRGARTVNRRKPELVTQGAPKLVKQPIPNVEGLLDWVMNDARLVEFCASAVDPLEVAARLETFGLSARVARTRFGFPHVFAAAEIVYDTIPNFDVAVEDRKVPLMGRPMDLLRGALYAIPAVFFSVIILAFGLGSHWWLLPVGLTTSWGTSQAFSSLGWAMRARSDTRSDGLMAACSMLVTLVLCLAISLVVSAAYGGSLACVVVAVSLGLYISASSILVFHEAEYILVFCLVPAIIGSTLSLGVISDRDAAWCVAVSAALVVFFAVGPVASSGWRVPSFALASKVEAFKFMLYGVGCGLLTSAVIAFGTHGAQTAGTIAVAAGPLLLTLGLMEWQLRSLRSRTARALAATTELDQFGLQVRNALKRSIFTYTGVLLAISIASVLAAILGHITVAPLLVVAIDALGISFFLALILVSAGLIDLVLWGWVFTFVITAGTLFVAYVLKEQVTSDAGLLAVLLGSTSGITTLAILSRKVLSSPLTYEAKS
jgi:hypothetical protein